MFERYTESARRVIFFARYEASNYGSHFIETEHLLLGLLREDYGLKKWFPDSTHIEEGMRADIEMRITRGERISTSVEIPISAECKRVLNLAAETADRLSHRRIEPVHLLVGLLLVENSIAGQLLIARGLQPGLIREALAKSPSPIYRPTAETSGLLALITFLDGLRVSKAAELIDLFAGNAEFIDSLGRVWIREDIWKGFDTLFAPYAKKNAAYAVEATPVDAGEVLVRASVMEERSPRERRTYLDAPNDCFARPRKRKLASAVDSRNPRTNDLTPPDPEARADLIAVTQTRLHSTFLAS